MTDCYVDLNGFPPFLHRIVKSWYLWQEVYLRELGRRLGDDQREPKAGETPERVFWGRQPPMMTKDCELGLVDDADVSYYLVCRNEGHYIDSEERGSRRRYWMFRRFEDAEKYLLFIISQMARPGKYTNSVGYRWVQEGLDARVSLSRPDPVNFPGCVSLRVDDEATDRGWMAESDAVQASHILVLTFEELDTLLREGIPADWFTISIVTD
ncbi:MULTISPECIES: hypothetical protein [Mycobacterium]|uniref:Uncharacterized protein n=2 Tax=Mycobacterium persicum TaxID=1487726 RepID=A0AB38V163_9MYCO|nr:MULTISPECIES: hypothetical protein [Mycobacterium]VAZ70107.1 hypothetical protein LAUMK15_00165 [Mycobacterium persicum]VAZ86750.1 hypothetical protein LAUMK42_05604 [Mycobacterium persicum]VBA31282.1 hypothetical protein LAUMK4_05435 [Mycobacterium persicum]